MKKYLVKLADHLDKKGLHKEADYVDWILKKSENKYYYNAKPITVSGVPAKDVNDIITDVPNVLKDFTKYLNEIFGVESGPEYSSYHSGSPYNREDNKREFVFEYKLKKRIEKIEEFDSISEKLNKSFENNKFYREVFDTGQGKELKVHVLVPLENIIDYLEDFRNDDPHIYGDYIATQ